IYNHGGTMSLDGVTITDNGTRGAGGGGINNKGTATVTNCTISRNVADQGGGGIYNDGNLTLTDCTISDNTSKDNGGGMNTHNTATVSDCTFTNNSAAVDGGALYTYDCTVTLTGCTINNNKAEASGGAIRVYGGTVELDHTTLSKNDATWYGGGIYINNDATLKLFNSTSITDNIGYHGGGGAYVESQTTEVQVGSGVVVKDNQANNLYLKGDKKLNVIEKLAEGTAIGVSLENYGGTFTTGFNENNPDVDPNSVFVAEPGYSVVRDKENGEAHVVTSDWIYLQALIDQAAESGEMFILDRSWQAADENDALVIPAGKQKVTIDLNGYTIDRHRSSYVADGEVFTVNGELSIVDNSYEKKGAVRGGYGDVGGIRVNGGGTLKLQSGNITGNHSTAGGGGVRVFEGGTMETFGGTISGNTSDADGGGVYNSGTFTNSICSISNNKAGGSGGGIYNTGTATLGSGAVSSNKANASGGGIHMAGGTLIANAGGTPVDISSNTAQGDGGGLYVAGGTAATFNAGTITSNSTGGSGGGAYLAEGGTLNFYDATMTSNYAAYDGGGIYNSKGAFNVKGAPQVTQNAAPIGRNILLAQDSRVTIADALGTAESGKAHLDVITLDSAQPLTSGFTAKNCDITCFTTNDADQNQLEKHDDGELYVKQGAGDMEARSWAELEDAVRNVPDGGTAVLKADVIADDDDIRILLGGGKHLTIDLNGYKVDRNLGNSGDDEGEDGHVFEVDGDATLTIKDTVGTGVITGGYADNGGGVYVHEGSALNLQGGTLMNNRADEDGGGIYVRGTLVAAGGAIVRNAADDNGGGIYSEDDGSLDLSNTVISNNTSGNEGGGLDIRVETASIKGCSIRDNVANDDGGGINVDRGDLLLAIENTDIVGNTTNGGHKGGGIFLNDGGINMTGGSISNNFADDGGGIYNDDCYLTLDGVTLSGNRTDEHGGAGISNHGKTDLTNCTFSGNVAVGEGGAIYCGADHDDSESNDNHLTATNCTFDGNESTGSSGGGICTGIQTNLTNCTLTGNKAHDSGGALCVHGDTYYSDFHHFYLQYISDVVIDGGTISGNEATEHGGGIMTSTDAQLKLYGNTSELKIAENSCSLTGSGVYVHGETHLLELAGKVTVDGNDAESDLFLADDMCVKVTGPLDGSQVRVALERGAGTFTKGLEDHASGVDPDTFFLAPTGQWVLPDDDGEAQVVPSDWSLLQRMIDETEDGATLKLERDWKAAVQENESLKVAGKSITIDLAGHTIDRARSSHEAAGEAFTVSGTLTVTDTSEGAAGKICGGYGDGGGVVVQDGGTLNMQGGNISGNRGKTGAGVLVGSGGQLNMTGGTIKENHADVDGGGVYSAGTTEMTGGQITGNEASGSGGGISTVDGATLKFGNAPIVAENIASQGSNLMLAPNVVMTITQKLSQDARIDLVAQSPNRAFTSGLTTSGSADVAQTVFTYDKVADRLEVRDDGELHLIQGAEDVVEVGDWQALQNAINDENNRDKVIRLANDITASDDDDRLLLDGKSVIVDLNGHTLNRDLDDDDRNGHVFEVLGGSTLTIRDTAGAGRVTGGYAKHGGAINIAGDSTCIVEGGTFIGNRASDEGGAFYVYGTLKMTGGVITQNTTDSGGGIFVDENGTIELTDVVIVNNKAEKWGGGAINNKGNATLANCTIKENWADNEGGAIYNGEKQLTIDGCTITDNSSSGGGGLCCYGTVNISHTTISNNYGDDYGGGLYTRGVVNISDSHIANNKGKTDGGGIFNQGGLLTATGTDFSGNSTEAGGGALNNKGTATLTGCTMTGNHADSEGGCIYEGTDGATTIDGCTIQNNSCGKDGGAIAACGTMTVSNSTISENTAEVGGAGVYSYGDTTIVGTTIESNKAKDTGGGLLSRKRTLTLDGATVTENSASSFGGGLMVEGGSGDVIVKGATTVKSNGGSGDVYLSAGKVLTVGGALEDDAGNAASISFRTESGLGTIFTSGYSDTNAGKNPATYFSSNDGYLVYLEGVEASTMKETAEDEPFVDPGSQVNPDVGTLTAVNWMSGISGERRVNEINLPGTHDSATNMVKGNLSTGALMDYIQKGGAALGAIIGFSLVGLGAAPVFGVLLSHDLANAINDYCSTFANCQTRYIDEQLQDGVRHLDLRCNTYYVEAGWPSKPKKDNGVDLYLCHGKVEMTGTFYAYDERTSKHGTTDYITFRDALGWIKTFLEEHPTETITMNVQVESVDDVQEEGIARIKKHIHEELATQINPSTGKPYLYMEDGVFGKLYSEYPKLKDCRGQVVLDCGDGDAEILGGLKKGVGLTSVEGPDGDYTDNAEQKIRNLQRFFADHGYDDLPSTAYEAINFLYSVGTNGTDSRSIPQITPLEIAEDVLEALFGEDGLLLNKEGKYIGLINMDDALAENNKVVWSSNFFNSLQYCKVTSKSGLDDGMEKVSYVLYGTKIDIPDCIYSNPTSDGKYFQTWQGTMDNSASGTTWTSDPSETFIITGDTTFTAQWGEQNTPVSVMWRDAENKDNLRPGKLSIAVNGIEQPVEVLPSKNWKVAVPGDVKVGDITVNWDGISADDPAKYTCEVREREGGIGIVIELTHTPQGEVQANGTVRWVDKDDAAGKRPENVTVHLVADNSRVIDSAIVTAENGWAWDLGTRPQYVDGAEVNYSVREDAVEGYSTYDKGFEIINAYGNVDGTTELVGMIVWSDDGNKGGTRPDRMTVNLLKDGQIIDSQDVGPGANGLWTVDFEVLGSLDAAAYTVTTETVPGYTTKAFDLQQTGGILMVVNTVEGHEHKPEKVEMVLLEPTCTTDGLKRTVELCAECGEVFADEQETLTATGHDWGEWKTVKEATSTQVGEEKRVCKHDSSHVQTRLIPKKDHEHALTKVEGKAATCTEDGIVEHYRCTGGTDPCGLCFRDAEGTDWIHEEATIAHAIGHDWGEWTVVQEPSELSFGFERRVCANDPAHVQVRMIPMTGHVHGLVHVDAKEATCTDNGNIEYWKCEEGENPCGLYFRDAAGTQWIHQEATAAHATGHEWGEWRITKAPTESEDGMEERTCRHDPAHTQSRVISKLGHVHELAKVEGKAATCTEDGIAEHWKCEECGMLFRDAGATQWIHEEATVVHALGHEWGEATYEWNADNTEVTATHVCLRDATHSESETVEAKTLTYVQPTCTQAGKSLIISKLFRGEGFMPQVKQGGAVPALGHSWGAWTKLNDTQHQRVCAHDASHVQKANHVWGTGKVTKKPTAYKTGVRTYTCAECKATKTEIIPTTVKKGASYKVRGNTYKVMSNTAKKRTVTLVKAKPVKKGKRFAVPAKVKIKGATYKVIAIGAKAFKGSKAAKITVGKNVRAVGKKSFAGAKKVKTIVVGAGVKRIAAKSFATNKALRTLQVKTKLLKKATVKRSLAGSKVKTLKVKVGPKALNKRYVKAYKKIFVKSNSGRKVTVR
ncbi:MAG TPA: hypothetical protein DCP91_06030, partial [Eggerthellaceae bacterium]|nr:hypothetical protein [Eggerthellaceae bacterium]